MVSTMTYMFCSIIRPKKLNFLRKAVQEGKFKEAWELLEELEEDLQAYQKNVRIKKALPALQLHNRCPC